MGMLKKVNREVGRIVRSDIFECLRILHGRKVSERFSQILLPQQTANNFAALCFGELANGPYGPRFERGAEAIDQMRGKLQLEIRRRRNTRFRHDKRHDAFALQRIRNPDDGCFRNRWMLD